MNDTINKIMIESTKKILQSFNNSDFTINILINTNHYKYSGITKDNKEILLILQKDIISNLHIGRNSFSFSKNIENKNTVFAIPYQAIISILIPENNFVIEREKQILYKVLTIKKKFEEFIEENTKTKKTTIIDINKYKTHE